jgi:glutamine cyclotransferase
VFTEQMDGDVVLKRQRADGSASTQRHTRHTGRNQRIAAAWAETRPESTLELNFVVGSSGFIACILAALLGLFHVVQMQAAQAQAQAPVSGYQVVRVYPHDRNAFTQGLIFLDGFLYESTGLTGKSSLRKVQLETGRVLQDYALPAVYFAEGLTNWGPDLVQLTWTANTGFVYDRASFKVKSSFSYSGEGWGITNDGRRLIMSDGTDALRFLDPVSLRETGRLKVNDRGRPVRQLNELEFIRGEIYANVWQTDRIARISPQTGEVLGWIDLRGVLAPGEVNSPDAVLNGIAYDSRTDRLFVTGKLWPKLFEIKVVPRR